MKKLQVIVLVLIFTFGFIVRLYRFDNPIADWHSWRQADTSAVSRNFVDHGFDILHPRFDDLSNVPSGLENPFGYRFVEFPLYNIAQAGLFVVFHHFTIEEWGRLVNIFASLFSGFMLYLILRKYISDVAGISAAFFYLFLPYSIYYSRTLLPDVSMTTMVLSGTYFFDKWLDTTKKNKWIYGLLALFFISASFLIKPYALFFMVPLLVMAWNRYGWGIWKRWELVFIAVLAVIPLLAWRLWMQQFPEGIPVSAWLLNGGEIRFKGAFFYWLFADRIGRLIAGYWGLGFLVAGFLYPLKDKKILVIYSFLVSSLIYMTVIARGNVQHDYYQILIIPTLAMFMGIGVQTILDIQKNKLIAYSLIFVITAFSVFFGWYYVRDYFNINNEAIVRTGKAVDALIPKDAKVIVPYDGDTSFLYQTRRSGWASFEHPLPEMIELGADYLVLLNTNPKDFDFGKTYKIVSSSKDYILFDLRSHP